MRQAVYEVLAGLPGPKEGRVWPVGAVRSAFESAVESAKLGDSHFHDCRHHLGSWWVMRGGSLTALQVILGHKDIKMTVRYAHHAQEHLRNEIAKTERRSESVDPSAQGSAQVAVPAEGVSQKSLQ